MTDFNSPYRRDIYTKYKTIEESGRLGRLIFPDTPRKTLVEINGYLAISAVKRKLDQRIISLAVTYFYQFLARSDLKKLGDLTVYSKAALVLSSKAHSITINFDKMLSDKKGGKRAIINAELEIFNSLSQNLILPNIYYFLELYYEFMTDWDDGEFDAVTKYITLMYTLSGEEKYYPSLVALGCIYLAKFIVYNEEPDNLPVEDYTKDEVFAMMKYLYVVITNEEYNISTKITDKLFAHPEYLDIPKLNELDSISDYEILYPYYLPISSGIDSNFISPDDINEIFEIGEGGYGKVYRGTYNNTNVAFKDMNCEIEDGTSESILKEITILKYVTHANLLDIERVTFDVNSMCYGVIFELMEGDLFSKISKDFKYRHKEDYIPFFNEYKIKRYSSQILQGLEYLHSNGIIHHDIKPQNVLIKGNDIKLADYGLSEVMVTRRTFLEYEFTFTHLFAPPEVIIYIEGYNNPSMLFQMGYEVDVWAAGLTIAMMSTGFYILGQNNESMIFEVINFYGLKKFRQELGRFLAPDFGTLPSSKGIYKEDIMRYMKLKTDNHYHFIMSMLELNPQQRVTARGALRDPFLVL